VCDGARSGEPERFPVRTRKIKRTAQSLWVLLARRDDGAVWLEKRPATGIWAGLHCLPVFDSAQGPDEALPPQVAREPGEPFVHVLTHKDLHMHPVHARVRGEDSRALADRPGRWVDAVEWPGLGLPAPVRRLLEDAGG